MLKRASLVAAVCLAANALAPAFAPDDVLVYFGTYTDTTSKGIYVSRLNRDTGALSTPELAAESRNPSFLAASRDGRFLYAVNEVEKGAASAFAIDKQSSRLTPLNQQPTGGADPAHLSIDRDGRTVLVANYTGGSVAAFPIGPDGRLGALTSFVQHTGHSVNPDRQTSPHAHQVLSDPRNRFVYVADLGLDKIMIYKFDPAAHTLAAAAPGSAAVKPGAGPRHLTFDAVGRNVYVINELDCTITAFRHDAGTGALTEFQTISSLPPGEKMRTGFSTAEIRVAPSGRFLYGSNRGHDSISVFAIDPFNGKLTYVANTPAGGKTPRGFDITPGGEFLVAGHQNSNSVAVFRVDRQTGKLTPAGAPIAVPKPVDVTFVE
jgi:6-phosphogluconolactonase